MSRLPAVERSGAFRILYVSPASGYSGAGHMLQALAAAIPAANASQSAVIGLEGVLSDRLRAAGCHVLCPNSDVSTERDDNRVFAQEVLRSVRPDVIHFNSAPGAPFLTAAREEGAPTLVHVRTAEFEVLEPALAAARRIAAVSEFIRNRLLRAGIPGERIEVIYDGVDSAALRRELFDRKAVRRSLGIEDGEFVALMIARLAKQKRHDLVLEAVAVLAARNPAVRLLLVGDRGNTRLYNSLCARVSALGLHNRVVWLPFQTDVRPFEAAADALVLYSENEALGTCVLEAMAMELPVVVADSGGLPEMIEDGLTGTIVPPGQPEALSNALWSIRSNPDEFARRAKAARICANEKFAIADHARRMEDLLRAAADHSRNITC
jgi:glycosyltransferase involved in cell wall biosynthesis